MRPMSSVSLGLMLLMLHIKQYQSFTGTHHHVTNAFYASWEGQSCYSSSLRRTAAVREGNSRLDRVILLFATLDDTATATSLDDKERMEQRIRREFGLGSEGILDKDIERLFRPGMDVVLSYQPAAQKAWIRRVAAARGLPQDVDIAVDATQHASRTRPMSVVAASKEVTLLERAKSFFSGHDNDRSMNHKEEESETSDSSSPKLRSIVVSKQVTVLERVRTYFTGGQDDDGLTIKQKLAKLGVSVALSYAFVSNLAGCSSLVLTWYIFCKKTGLSPLVEGQWKPFLAVYAGFYIFHNIVRPARFALSVALGPKFDRLLAWVQNRFRVNKGVAILMVMLSLNVVCSCGGMCAGIFLVSKMTGVPIFPGK